MVIISTIKQPKSSSNDDAITWMKTKTACDKVFNQEFSAINLCQFPLEIAAMTKTGCVN